MSQPLSNPETITIGSSIEQEVECSQCHKKGKANEFFTYAGKKNADVYICGECRAKINTELENKIKNPNLVGAIGFGILASIAGGIIWYFITILIEREFGYVAIGLGYLIGFGVHLGSGRKYGRQMQGIAAFLTLLAIFIAEYFIYNYFINQYIQANLSEFPGLEAGTVVWLPFMDLDFLKSLVSPIGLLIYAIGAYVAYRVPQVRKV